MSGNALIHPYSIVSRNENEFIRIVSGNGVKLTDTYTQLTRNHQ